MARIAHRPVIAVAAFSKFPIYALRGVTVVAGYRLAQGLGIQTKLLRQRGQGIGFVQIASGDRGVIIDRRRARQPEAITLHRLASQSKNRGHFPLHPALRWRNGDRSWTR